MVAPIITHVDAVALALPYLRTALADGTVTVEWFTPNPRPAKLVVLRRSGGTEHINGIFDRPRLDATVWAATEFDAQALAERVRAHLCGAPGRCAGVSAASTFLGPTSVPDTDGTPRVLLSVEWQTRGTQS